MWLAVAIIAAVATYNNVHKIIWTDEAYAFDTASGTLARTFQQALRFELQPPLYFVLLNSWLRIHHSMEFGRFLSTLFVLGSIPFLVGIARLLGSRIGPRLVVLAALCPYLLWAASEQRVYGLTILLTAGATFFYLRLILLPEWSWRDGVLFVVIWYLALLTFYYSGFLLAGQLLGALLIGRRFKLVLICALTVGLLLLPWLPTIFRQMTSAPLVSLAPQFGGDSVLWSAWMFLRWAFEYTLISLFKAPALRRPTVQAVLLVAAATMAIIWWRGPRMRRDPRIVALAASSFFPLGVLLVGGGSGLLGAEPRYFGIVLVNLLALLSVVADQIQAAGLRRAVEGGMLAFGLLTVIGFQRNNRGHEDWKSAAELVTTTEQPHEPVFVFEPDAALPFSYYYRAGGRVFGLPIDRPTDTYSMGAQAATSTAQIRARVLEKVNPAGTLWLVARRPHSGFGRRYVDDFLRETTILEQFHPAGVDLFHLRLGSPP